MLHVCYMFEQHVTWLNPFVQGHLSHIMLYGYMFLRTFSKKSANCTIVVHFL